LPKAVSAVAATVTTNVVGSPAGIEAYFGGAGGSDSEGGLSAPFIVAPRLAAILAGSAGPT